MKACDNCQSTDGVETVYVQVTTEQATGSRHVDLCAACVERLADTAELTLVAITSHGLGHAPAAPSVAAPFRDATPPAASNASAPTTESPPAQPTAPQPADTAVESAEKPAPLVPTPTL